MYADIVLPATTFLEHYDMVKGYGPISLQLARPVIDQVGEARPNADVFADLLRRLDLSTDADPANELETALAVVGALPERHGDALRDTSVATPDFGGRPIQFVDVFPRTADAKIHLCPAALDAEAPLGLYGYHADPASADYPLALISPASDRTISSTLGELPRPAPILEMHPDDAAARALEDGDNVRVFNELGEIRLAVRVTRLVRAGTVATPKGVWRRHMRGGHTSNALIPDTLADLGGGACFNDARVQVQRVEEGKKFMGVGGPDTRTGLRS
jgi:anaerobic selenocysteine-containing dehydrogenase